MKRKLGILHFIFILLPLAGCENDVLPPGEERISRSTYIDEPILLETSELLSPIRIGRGEIFFDFSSVPLIQKREYNDFELTYWTPSSCDEDKWVYNYKAKTWDQIGFAPGPGVFCLMMPSQKYHLFSAKGFNPKEYMNETKEMRIRHGGYIHARYIDIQVRALKINPDYLAVPILLGERVVYSLAYDRQSFWICAGEPQKINNISHTGAIIREFLSPGADPYGLTFDGQNLWLADGSNRIFKLTRYGNVLCQFTVPTNYPGGLAWGDNKLWLTEYNKPYRLFCINPAASCSAGSAVITDTFQTPGGSCYGIAWDGNNLLVASDSLYKVSTNGVTLKSYALPVRHVSDITWDGEAVWMLNWGPKEFKGSDPVITRFKLR